MSDAELEAFRVSGSYREALEGLPSDHPARGEFLFWSEEPSARQWLSESRDPASRVTLARLCWRDDDYQQGLRLLDLADTPRNAEADFTRGLLLLCEGQDGPGEVLVFEALPKLAGHQRLRAYHDLAVTYQFKKMNSTAAAFYRKAYQGWLELGPRHPEAVKSLVGLAGSLEEIDPGCQEMGEVTRLFLSMTSTEHPHRPSMMKVLGAWHAGREEWSEAEPLLVEVTKLVPERNVLELLGQVQYLRGESRRCLETMNRVKGLVEGTDRAGPCWLLIARCLYLLDEPGWDEAYRKAIQANGGAREVAEDELAVCLEAR